MIGLSDPLVLDLGSVRPRLPSLDSAFLLRRLPLFFVFSPLSSSQSHHRRARDSKLSVEASPSVLEPCLVKCYIMPCSAVRKEGNL